MSCKQWDIRQVPLHVLVDGMDLRDGIDDVPYDVYNRPHVTTAGAAPAELVETYRQALADSGGDGVVAVHLSAALSSTFSTAVAAAREFGPSVRVVNSRSAAMGVGFVATRRGTRRGRAVSDLEAVEAAARSARAARRTPSSSSTGWTTCGAAGGSAPRRPGWAPRCRSSHCCVWTSTAGWCSTSGSARSSKAHAAMVDGVAEVVGERRATSSCTTWTTTTTPTNMGAALTAPAAADRVAHRGRHGSGAVGTRGCGRGRRGRVCVAALIKHSRPAQPLG